MFNQYNPIMDIDRKIQELEELKKGYQKVPQPQPITNIINTSNNDFEARLISGEDNPEDILIYKKTAFIDLTTGRLMIKELDGDIKQYEILLPKTPDQLKIEELERRLAEYEQQSITTTDEESKSDTDVTK